MTNSNLATASVYQRHYDARMARLRGTNHAGVLSWPCATCLQSMDVGYERLIHPTFVPRCFDCSSKETP